MKIRAAVMYEQGKPAPYAVQGRHVGTINEGFDRLARGETVRDVLVSNGAKD